jgi:hypothetical protein
MIRKNSQWLFARSIIYSGFGFESRRRDGAETGSQNFSEEKYL